MLAFTALAEVGLADVGEQVSTPIIPVVTIGAVSLGFVDYIFRFPDAGSAKRDPVIGQYFAWGQPLNEVLVFQNGDTVDSSPGYWPMISLSGGLVNTGLAQHPNIEIVNSRTLQLAGQPSVYLTNLPLPKLAIVISNFGSYAQISTLRQISNLLLEDGTFLLLEDGISALQL